MPRHRTARQPVRVPTGGPRGQRQALEAAQSVVPLPDRTESTVVPPAGGGGGQGQMPVVPDIFGPTDRPSEPITAGAGVGPGPTNPESMLPDDPLAAIRQAYLMFPSPGLARLLERASETGEVV